MPVPAADPRPPRTTKALAGLAAPACLACCLLPVLVTAGVVGAGAAAIVGWPPAIAITLAALAGVDLVGPAATPLVLLRSIDRKRRRLRVREPYAPGEDHELQRWVGSRSKIVARSHVLFAVAALFEIGEAWLLVRQGIRDDLRDSRSSGLLRS